MRWKKNLFPNLLFKAALFFPWMVRLESGLAKEPLTQHALLIYAFCINNHLTRTLCGIFLGGSTSGMADCGGGKPLQLRLGRGICERKNPGVPKSGAWGFGEHRPTCRTPLWDRGSLQEAVTLWGARAGAGLVRMLWPQGGPTLKQFLEGWPRGKREQILKNWPHGKTEQILKEWPHEKREQFLKDWPHGKGPTLEQGRNVRSPSCGDKGAADTTCDVPALPSWGLGWQGSSDGHLGVQLGSTRSILISTLNFFFPFFSPLPGDSFHFLLHKEALVSTSSQ